ncbi:Transcription termination factor 2 [Sergentomyia squamirostris]
MATYQDHSYSREPSDCMDWLPSTVVTKENWDNLIDTSDLNLYCRDFGNSMNDLSNIRGMLLMDQTDANQTNNVIDEGIKLEEMDLYDGEIPEDFIEVNTIEMKQEEISSGFIDEVKTKIDSFREKQNLEKAKRMSDATLEIMKKSDDSYPAEDELMEQPDGLQIKLMDHQRHALSFMTWRERNEPKGGILADDMGTGKTLTILSLILLDQANPDENLEQGNSRKWMNKGRKRLIKGGTLVVCPATLMQQWCNEVDTKCRPAMIHVYKHHGPHRFTRDRQLADFDLVVTTYNTLNRELEVCGPLFRVNWHRVVLDEGHVIRNHRTGNALACFELSTTRRWILTGTPLHNYIKDFYSTMKFLKCDPFNDYEGYWKPYIGGKRSHPRGVIRVNAILKTLMLRRTKKELEDRGILPKLPEKTVKTISVTLSDDERMLYQKFLLCSQSLFVEYLHQCEKSTRKDEKFREKTKAIYRQISAAYENSEGQTFIFVLLLRLRQICCHPHLLKIAYAQDDDEPGPSTRSNNAPNLVDLVDQLQVDDKNIALTNLPSLKYNKEILNANVPSTKLSHILSEMEIIMAKGEKMVVISQWVQFLNILERHLLQREWKYLIMTGQTKVSDRGELLANFNDPQNPNQILLLSLGTGGVGINLVGANNIFLMDSHWNPQWERQAEDRVYRIGQTKPVTVYKYVTIESIEERIVKLQMEKLELAESVLSGAKRTKRGGLTIAELRLLFNM